MFRNVTLKCLTEIGKSLFDLICVSHNRRTMMCGKSAIELGCVQLSADCTVFIIDVP